MDKNKNDLTSIIVGSVAGFTLGWMVKNFSSKRLQLEENKPLLHELKRMDQKVYEDGKKKAEEIGRIKNDVKSKVGN